jgi:hypothetical protein
VIEQPPHQEMPVVSTTTRQNIQTQKASTFLYGKCQISLSASILNLNNNDYNDIVFWKNFESLAIRDSRRRNNFVSYFFADMKFA